MKYEFKHLGNAGGTARTLSNVIELSKSAATRILVGSYTLLPREGNAPIPGGEVYYFDTISLKSVNSIGLKNLGLPHYMRTGLLREMVEIAHDAGKELWVSIAGYKVLDFIDLARMCVEAGVDGIEINLGCPNVHDGNVSHEIFSYNPGMCAEIMGLTNDEFGQDDVKVSAKISPVPNELIEPLCKALVVPILSEVVAINTVPNQQLFDRSGRSVLAYIPQGGRDVMHVGGGGGKAAFADGLRVVEAARKYLPDSVDITGVGGIFTGDDAFEYVKAGANGFQCGTAYYNTKNPKLFGDIAGELLGLMEAA